MLVASDTPLPRHHLRVARHAPATKSAVALLFLSTCYFFLTLAMDAESVSAPIDTASTAEPSIVLRHSWCLQGSYTTSNACRSLSVEYNIFVVYVICRQAHASDSDMVFFRGGYMVTISDDMYDIMSLVRFA